MSVITASEREYLLNSMQNLLDEYDYEYTLSALNKILDTWATEKQTLIEAFKKHPNYLEGKFMIAFTKDYERNINIQPSIDFSQWVRGVAAKDCAADVPTEIIEQRTKEGYKDLPDSLWHFFAELSEIAVRTITSETADKINEILPDVHAHNGEKTSRVVNRICTYLGYNKHPEYNREFAKYADSLSPLIIKRHTVLSLNPLDYLTMSFGNSWASCHTIDKENRRRMPNSYEGQYSSGTISYMLDPSSMVFYTVDASYNGNEYWNQPKINRQMFHWGQEKLVQGRLYPQDNDGCDSVYVPYRNIVQEIISTIFEFPNLWTLKKGTTPASEYIYSYGTHYCDYNHYSNCSLSRPKGNENENYFDVGASPICIECGERHDNTENINCCHGYGVRCADCGCTIYDEDGEYWVNGDVYCRDCVSYCDYCEEYHRGENYYIEGRDIDVCEYCYNEYFVYCECCACDVHRDDATWVESENSYVCDDCLYRYYTQCDECDEWVRRDDVESDGNREFCPDCYEKLIEDNEAC